MKKYLVLDLDGTILDDNKNIYREFMEILPRIRKKFEIIVATGRAKFSVETYISIMDIRRNYVSFEGAYVVWNGRVIFKKTFTRPESEFIEKIYGNVAMVKFFPDKVKPNEKFCRVFPHYLKRWGAELIGESGEGVFKYVLAVKKNEENLIKNLVGTVFVFKRNDDVFYDIAPHTTKAKSLKMLMDKFGINPRQCVAVGDYYNDIEVFKICGFSIAVPHAPYGVKKSASTVGYIWDERILRILEV